MELGFTEGFEKLAYGRDQKTANILSQVDGTFHLEFSFFLGETIKAIEMDRQGLYYNAITVDGTLYVFYQCSTGCASCSFPNNCSACEDDYILKGVYCFPKPTQCVGNILLKDNICQ